MFDDYFVYSHVWCSIVNISHGFYPFRGLCDIVDNVYVVNFSS